MTSTDDSVDLDLSPPVHVDDRVAAVSIVGFWLFYFIVNTIHMAIQSTEPQWQMMERRAVVTVFGMGLTWLLQLLLRRIDHRSPAELITTAFVSAFPLAFAYATVNFVAFYVFHPSRADMMELGKTAHGPAQIIADTALTWYFFVVAWAVLYIALSYAVKVRQAERATARYRAEAQMSQLRALRYQVNPHFLFNTLNSLSTLVLRERTAEAERMIMNLATFFRSSLTTEVTEDVPLADEIRLQRLYLDIEQVRFPDRLRVQIDVPPDLERASIPAMLLQPLVENAIKHGVARSNNPVTLAIRARRQGDAMMLIEVEDDAVPASDRIDQDTTRHYVGLRNVCTRVTARYGDTSSCRYAPRAGGGFTVTLLLPFQRHG